MHPPTPPCCVPGLLCILLLQVGALSTHHEVWDNPICTKGLSVSQGQRAVMTCNISNTFTHVTISLESPGRDSRVLFDKEAPCEVLQDRWQLQVQGHMARLWVTEVWPEQAGLYTWMLRGQQRRIQKINLNMTGYSPNLEGQLGTERPGPAISRQNPETSLSTEPRDLHMAAEKLKPSPAMPQERQKVPMILSITSILLCVLVLVCIVWNRRRVAPQIWMIPTQETDYARLVSTLQP